MMTEVGAVTEATLKSNIEIVVPEPTKKALTAGWDETRAYLQKEKPNHIFLLGRSAELAASPLEADLGTNASTIHIGRELYHNPGVVNYEYFSNAMARRFLSWFDSSINGQLAPFVKQIELALAKKEGSLKFALIDDVVETGGTYLVAAWLLRYVLAQKGITNVSFSSSNEALARSLMMIPPERKATSDNGSQVEVQVLTLSSDNDWRHNIIHESFAQIMKSLSDVDVQALDKLLGDLVKGSREVEGETEPVAFGSWNDVEARGVEVKAQFKSDSDPVALLENKYTKEDIQMVGKKFRNVLREAGRQ